MRKIANNHELQQELHKILAACQGSERPSRQKLAAQLNDLADRLEDKTAGAAHARNFQSLVKVIDAFDDANKKLQRQGARALQDIKDAFEEDAELTKGGNLQYGFDQQVEQMADALKEAASAAESLTWAFDEFNRWSLKWMK